MSRPFLIVRSAAIVCSLLTLLVFTGSVFGAEAYKLDNGMTVILKEQPGTPMVSSMVFVRSGSKYESRFENGITHFLEHLLFDGTTSLSRKELDGAIRDLGGYINAFTRKELTAYLVLLPKQYIDYGMTVQADMLFNSVIPESQLPKERKVVIEEIKRDADAPGSAAEKFFTSHAYADTEYDRPVLGYRAFIENIPREAIVDYWKRYYIPRNMTLLVIGDFESEQMKESVAAIFGQFDNDVTPVDTSMTVQLPPPDSLREVIPQISPVGQEAFDTVANVSSTYIKFSFAAPHYSDSIYYAMDVLSQYLAMDEVSPLKNALTGGAEPPATEVGVSLIPFEEFSRLEVSAITDDASRREEIVAVILRELAQINRHAANTESIEGIKTSVRTEGIYNQAKLHYYGFMISPYMMTAGYDFIESYVDNIGAVTWADCVDAAEKWLVNPNYVATVVRPTGETGLSPYEPETMSAGEVTAYFDTATFAEYDLTGDTLTYPTTDSIAFELTDAATYHREILPNGLTVIVKSTPGQQVFAMNVLGKNRSANEPADKAGITDFVNRCIEKGTVTRTGRELADDLAGIGAQVTLYDNPWIPYDDRYTTRQFSFMKFETIDEFARRGFNLFSEMVFSPAFDSVEVENVRQNMLGVLRRQADSPQTFARDLFYESLFEGGAYAKSIMGTPETISGVTLQDLKQHHATFYSPENLIISIVTQQPAEEIMSWFAAGPARFAAAGFESQTAGAPEPLTRIKTTQMPMEKEQVSIYLGGPLPGANSADNVPLAVATRVLSGRLYNNLRETQGLAYSVGAGATFDRGFGWYYCSMGTAAENYKKAVSGILLEIEKLQFDGPNAEEVERACNQMWGRLMSAKLSAINQAYYLGVNEFLGREIPHDPVLLRQLSAVNREAVMRVASRFFSTRSYVLSVVGKLSAEQADK